MYSVIDKQIYYLDLFKKIHGNTYGYEFFKYIDAKTKCIFICGIHGKFKQLAYSHGQGFGCDACSRVQSGKNRSITLESFKSRASEKFNNFYNYDNITSIDNNSSIADIECPLHGMFKQTIKDHLNNNIGCGICARNNTEHSKQSFHIKVSKLFPDYDFSEFIYINARTKGKYTCKYHGVQTAKPDHLLHGSGCPICNKRGRIEKSIRDKLRLRMPDINIHANKRPIWLERLEYDISFVLPNGIAIAIEYDGHQHFVPITFGGMSKSKAVAALKVAKFNDARKNKISNEHDINLFRIHYNDYNRDPHEVLDWLYEYIEYLSYDDDSQSDIYYTESYICEIIPT